MNRTTCDTKRLLTVLRGLDRFEVAQFLAAAVEEMVSHEIPADEIAEVCSSLCRRLGITAEELRKALH